MEATVATTATSLIKGDFKITLEPDAQLTFNGPFTVESKATLKLTNAGDKARAFKVKCTSNDLFKIRPAVGECCQLITHNCIKQHICYSCRVLGQGRRCNSELDM
jgi:hypothetical protein